MIILSFIASSLLTTVVQIWLQKTRDKAQAFTVNAAATAITQAAHTASVTAEKASVALSVNGGLVMDKLEQIHKQTNSTLSEAIATIRELRAYVANLERLLMLAAAGARPVEKT